MEYIYIAIKVAIAFAIAGFAAPILDSIFGGGNRDRKGGWRDM